MFALTHQTGQNLVFRSDHKIVKIGKRPLKGATIHNLDGDYIREGDYDDDDLFGENISDDEMDIEQARAVRNNERDEARKEEVLVVISAAAPHTAKERINGHQKIFMRRPDDALFSIARVRERVWGCITWSMYAISFFHQN